MTEIDNLAREAQRIEEDATFSSKSHYEAASTWRKGYLWLGLPTAIIAAISGVSAFQQYTLFAGIMAMLAAALASISTFLDPSEKAQAHHTAGNRFTSLKNKARIYREIELLEDQQQNQKEKLLQLSSERDAINEESPQIPRRAFEKARKGIEEGEAQYTVDAGQKNTS